MLVSELACAKINLALHITGRRRDGYHELDSIVAFAGVCDVLTIAPAASVSLSLSGPFAKDLTEGGDNSVLAAWRLLTKFAELTPVKFHLEKNLPVAAGIGGGSADAAAALRGLIKYFNLTISPQDLNNLALQLGADVPVCLTSKKCRIRGIGEIIEHLDIKLPVAIVLVNPLIPSPTAKVFEVLGLERGQSFATNIQDLHDVKTWRNELTSPAIKIVPEITTVIDFIKSQPNITCARMSGSGATCFGLADSLDQAELAAAVIKSQHPNWWVIATNLC